MKKNTLSRFSRALYTAILVAVSGSLEPILPVAYAQTNQELENFSVLPENLAGDVTSNPNVLIILDNSGSMGRFDAGGRSSSYQTDPITGLQYLGDRQHWDPSSSFTNSYQVRAAMQRIVSNRSYVGRLNVGIMTFAQNNCVYDPRENEPSDFENGRDMLYRCTLPDGTQVGGAGTPSRTGFRRGTNGLGSLRADFDNLDGEHREKLQELLEFEPSPYNSTNIASFGGNRYVVRPSTVTDSNPIHGNRHPFLDPLIRRIDGSEDVITSVPDQSYSNFTPLSGALDSAFRYMFKNDIAVDNIAGLDSKFKNGLIDREFSLGTQENAAGVTTAITPNFLSNEDCQGPLIVILLTDGDASQIAPDPLNEGVGGGGFNAATRTAAEDSARRIRYRGHATEAAARAAGIQEEDEVEVHVIGFSLNDTNLARSNGIAEAGGTGTAIDTDNTDEVESAFADIFNDILQDGASRSGLSVVTTPDAATGSFIQPSFTPLVTRQDASGATIESVTWTGDIRSFFIDRFGNFREDTNNNNRLDGNDKGFRILFSEIADTTFVERFDVNDNNGDLSNIEGTPDAIGNFPTGQIEVSDLQAVFSGAEQLDNLSTDLNFIRNNRNYRGTGRRRHLFTTLDGQSKLNFQFRNTGGTGFNQNNRAIFDLPSFSDISQDNNDRNADTSDLISYIRGYEGNDSNRNRTIDSKNLILGDIVHSTPVQVDGPLLSSVSSDGDYAQSFAPFAALYENRRKMVYVGANDGVMHAFSGGFWDVDPEAGTIEVVRRPTGSTVPNHQLGDEIWGFIPRAVLPHLKFLRDPSYLADRHVSYVDGSLQEFNVKIFTPSAKHPNGWGTILVGGLRLGGAPYQVDLNNDGDVTDDGEKITSSYFILDITDPENAPELIAEVTHPDLNLTTSKPVLVRAAGSNSANRNHLLVFGSGPDNLPTATSTGGGNASLFVFDLGNQSVGLTKIPLTSSVTNSFVGDLSVADWNQDDIDDAIYFGTVSGTIPVPSGQLFRAAIDANGNFDADVLVNVDLPIQHEPVIPADQETRSEKYVLFGTGRTFMIEDTNFNYLENNQLYGIRESFDNINTSPVNFADAPLTGDILETTNVTRTATADGDNVLDDQTRSDLITAFSRGDYIGWRFELPNRTSRLSARGVTLEELVFFSDFQPSDPDAEDSLICTVEGAGFLNVFDYRTGIFASTDRLQLDDSLNTGDTTTNALNFQVSSSQLGAAQIVVIGEDADGNTKFKYLAPGSNQEITELGGTLVPRQSVFNSGRKSWREIDF